MVSNIRIDHMRCHIPKKQGPNGFSYENHTHGNISYIESTHKNIKTGSINLSIFSTFKYFLKMK